MTKRLLTIALILFIVSVGAAFGAATPTPAANPPTVLTLSIVPAERAAVLIRALYPRAVVKVDRSSNAVIVVAAPDEVAGIRAVITGVDVKDPMTADVEALQLHTATPDVVANRLRGVFPKARLAIAPNRTIVIAARAIDMPQIKAVIAAIDTPPVAPTPKPIYPTQTIRVLQADASAVARSVAHAIRTLRVAVSGSDILVNGTPDDVAQAKAIIASLDHLQAQTTFAQVYRLHAVDAASVADLLVRSFHGIDIAVNKDLNALTIIATAAMQNRAGDAIAQLDVAPNGPGTTAGVASGGPSITDVVTLKAAVPAANGQASTSAADIAQSVSQALAGQAADLKIIVHPNSTRLILSGSAYSIELAKDLIAKLDVAEPLVELDTEVYEVDDGLQKQLGLKFPTAALSTTYSEETPAPNASGVAPALNRLQALTRTPLSLQAQLDFLVSTNRARILEDPRITTFSGHTASLRAGETVNVLTTAGGGSGTVATTQIQSFQTGVTLDITPVVNSNDYVTVSLHPSVNTEAGISAAGVPNIQTRDTTTTVGLHDGETIVVGGLIEDTDSRTVTKIPLLGDLPVIGRFFQDVGTSHTRNELVVTVTPHIIKDGFRADLINRDLPVVPTAQPLPPLEAGATLPPRRAQGHAPASSRPEALPSLVAPPAANAPATAPPTGATSAPSDRNQPNVFTFGSPPPNNYADANQAPQIFFVEAKPTVVRSGRPVTITAITTSNVTTVTVGSTAGDNRQSLGSIGAGRWEGIVTVNPVGGSSNGNVTMFLNATTSAGASVSLQVPFSLVR